MVAMLAITPSVATPRLLEGAVPPGEPPPISDWGEGLTYLSELKGRVERENACVIPGCPIRYENFVGAMDRAVHLGYVLPEHAHFVREGLRFGFTVGVDVAKLTGHRWFRNYPTALDARSEVTAATQKRVAAGRTIHLGVWSEALKSLVRATFRASFIFPMGAVPKKVVDPNAPIEYRPTSDHSRTGLNAATDLSFLRHSDRGARPVVRVFGGPQSV